MILTVSKRNYLSSHFSCPSIINKTTWKTNLTKCILHLYSSTFITVAVYKNFYRIGSFISHLTCWKKFVVENGVPCASWILSGNFHLFVDFQWISRYLDVWKVLKACICSIFDTSLTWSNDRKKWRTSLKSK